MEVLKKEMNNLKQDFEYLGQQMLRRVTEFKEEAEKDMDIGFEVTNKFMSRLEKDLDRANKKNAELNLKFNQTINEMDTKNNELFKKQAGRVHILFKL